MRLFSFRAAVRAGLAFTVAISLSYSAQATVITSIPGGTVYAQPPINYLGSGPQTLAPGVTWMSPSIFSVFGWTRGYFFASNGFWQGLPPMAGTNDGTSSMTFFFATPVSSVGGFLNYAPGYGTPFQIAVYDASNNLIESYNPSFSVSGLNAGKFYGFQESTGISSFVLTGEYAGLRDLTATTAAPVPEPGSIFLLGTGLAGVLARRFRRG